MSFPFACHSSPISRAPMASGLAVAQRFAIQCRGCRAPSAACADARANARRRSRSESVEAGFAKRHAINRAAGSQCSQLLTAEICADTPTLRLDAPASAKSTLARASRKSIPPRNAGALGGWLQQRSGVQTQFWSVVFIRDSLLQVNRNCRALGADASDSPDKGEVASQLGLDSIPNVKWLPSRSTTSKSRIP